MLIDFKTFLDILNMVFHNIFYFFLYTSFFSGIVVILQALIVFFFRNKKKQEMPFDLQNAPYVTVQIPTRNEVIAVRCAQMCLESDYPKEKLQVLIGDDSNQLEITRKIDAFAAENTGVQVVRRERNIGFKAGNLNNMLDYSKGEIIVILDSDFLPGRDFIRRIVAPFSHDKDLSAVQARWEYSNRDQNLTTFMASLINDNIYNVILGFLRIFGSSLICGSAVAIRKKIMEELGSWHENVGEDIEFSLRLWLNSRKTLYLDTLECKSELPWKLKDLCKQQMKWAYGHIIAFKLHLPKIFFNRNIGFMAKIVGMMSMVWYVLIASGIFLILFGQVYLLTTKPSIIYLYRLEIAKMCIKYVLVSSGYIYATFITLMITGRITNIFRMIYVNYTYGLVVSYYVTVGIYKAFMGVPMRWYLIRKGKDGQEELRGV